MTATVLTLAGLSLALAAGLAGMMWEACRRGGSIDLSDQARATLRANGLLRAQLTILQAGLRSRSDADEWAAFERDMR